MDNGNKIDFLDQKELQTHKEVQMFLKDELKTLEYSAAAAYNLEKEYERTKNNKNKSVWIILSVCVLVVIILTVGLSFFIRHSNNKIKVHINTFNDLNLKALLNSAGRAESLYENAVRSRDMLVAEMDDALNAAVQKRENDLFTLKSVAKVSSKKAVAEKQQAIQEQYEKSVKVIKEKYEPKIAAAEKDILSFKDSLSSFDSDRLSEAQSNQAAIDSQKQLSDMEMKNLEKRYQNRIDDLKNQMALQQKEAVKQQREAVEEVRRIYQAKIDLLDPDARSQSVVQDKIILDTGIPKSAGTTSAILFTERFDGGSYTSKFANPSENFVSSVKQSAVYLEDLNTIANRFSTIPLENTIRHYVPAMQRLAYQITTGMAEGEAKMQQEINDLEQTVAQKNQVLGSMSAYFDGLCAADKANVADGIVMDASNKNELKLYMTAAGQAKLGGEAELRGQVRNGTKIICDLTLNGKGVVITASPAAGTKPAVVNSITSGQKIYLFAVPKK